MDRLTNVDGKIENCLDCMEYSNCYETSCGKINKAIQKLAYYENLEEQNLLIKLPCKLRDIVYQIAKCTDGETRIFKMKVCNVCEYGSFYNGINKKFVWNVYLEDEDGGGYSYGTFYDFGKSIFLTREEAENYIKEKENM